MIWLGTKCSNEQLATGLQTNKLDDDKLATIILDKTTNVLQLVNKLATSMFTQ
jgi:hypothetical protein